MPIASENHQALTIARDVLVRKKDNRKMKAEHVGANLYMILIRLRSDI